MNSTKIMVVDDDYSSRLFLQKILNKENYQTSICGDGLEALELIDKQSFDLVITDLKMESIDGIELLEKLKDIDPEIAVIILTGHASIQTAIEALRLGASDYLTKPINIDEFRIRVKKALERRNLEKRLKEAERRITYNATITTANHEINQPLTVILSGIDMIKMELEKLNVKEPRIDKYIQLIQKSGHRIADILRKFREISSPVIQEIPHGMQMIELHIDQKKPLGEKNYILVIEDEENLREIVRDVLENAGFRVIVAASAEEGVEFFKMHHEVIDMVLLDFHLPDSPGSRVYYKLREVNPEIKVVITSGFELDQSIQSILDDGAIGFIRKPFDREQIVNLMSQVFDMNKTDKSTN